MVLNSLDQEQLSWAYLRAVIYSSGGYRISTPDIDDHRIDGSIKSLGRGVNQVDFQIKSTRRYEIRDNSIYYDLPVGNYNALIREDDMPRVLILYIMPDDANEWIAQSKDELCMRHCAYWAFLMGEPRSANESTQRVAVPTANILDADGLQNMFNSIPMLN